jgi:hypothetical protein
MGLRGCMLQNQRLHLGTVSVSSLLPTCARDSRYILLRHAHSVHRPTESTCRITWQMISSRKRRLGTTLSSAVSTSPSRCCLPLSSPFYVVNLVPISPSHHAHWSSTPILWLSYRLLQHPDVATAHLPRCIDRRGDRLLIHSLFCLC